MSKKKRARAKPDRGHGGRREGSGKPSFFPGASDEKPWIFRLTPHAKKICDERVAEINKALNGESIKVSRNAFVEGLIRRYGKTLTYEVIRAVGTR